MLSLSARCFKLDICSGWYGALSSRELVGKKTKAFRRFGLNLVAWRDRRGEVVVMEDLCPHRSVKLSLGKVKDDCIICPFHGFQFGNDGSCKLVPETGKAAPNLRCHMLAAREEHGLIWLWFGQDGPPSRELPWFDELGDGFAWSEIKLKWPSHITRCIENQLDYAHLPFVHKTTIGSQFNVADANFKFELSDRSIKLPMNEGFFEFKFPSIWQLQILPNKFYQFISFAPVDETETVMYLRSYQKFVNVPVLRDLLGLVFNIQSSVIIAQDKRVVLSHPPGTSQSAVLEKLYPSDNGVAHFRKYWRSSVPLSIE